MIHAGDIVENYDRDISLDNAHESVKIGTCGLCISAKVNFGGTQILTVLFPQGLRKKVWASYFKVISHVDE